MSSDRQPQPSPNQTAPSRPTAPTPSAEGGAPRLLKVGALAKATGKTVRAIRFYEELGLLSPVRRTPGGFRQFDDTARVRIHWIDRLQDLGFSLTEIRDFLSAFQDEESGPRAMQQLRAFYARKVLETRQSILRLQALEGELSESLAYLSTCQSCAPQTSRTACRSCDDEAHQGVPTPRMVLAVQDPA
jgi:DNA-binding transcriptional MerR regulator